MEVQLVSPEQVLYTGDADMVVCRTSAGGEIAFLNNHAPFLGALAAWPVRLVLANGEQVQFAVHGGFVEVSHNHVIILSDVASGRDRPRPEHAESGVVRDTDGLGHVVRQVQPDGPHVDRSPGSRLLPTPAWVVSLLLIIVDAHDRLSLGAEQRGVTAIFEREDPTGEHDREQ
jgi:F-type H+-transporting ATPase subunit epsilon